MELNLGRNCLQMATYLGPSCGMLEPSWAEVGARGVEVFGFLGESWPQVEPILLSCRIESANLDELVADMKNVQITTMRTLFLGASRF